MNHQMQKRAWALTLAMTAIFFCGGCSGEETSSAAAQQEASTEETESAQTTEAATNTTAAESNSTLEVTPLSNVTQTVEYDDDDMTSTYDTFDAEITLTGNTATVTGSTDRVSVSEQVVTIQDGGTYRVTGTLTDGQLVVTGTEKVKLYLDGVSITNEDGAAILCQNEKRTILSLADGTENIVSDGAGAASAEEPAAIYTEDKLTINGSGTLTVNGVAANGIVCRNDLKLVGGTIQVKAANNGIKGKDCVAMCGGDITIQAGNDGLKATEADDAARGWISVSGGTLNIIAEGDGVQAETDCWIDGGELHITTTGEITTNTTKDMFGGGMQDGGMMGGRGNRGGRMWDDSTAAPSEQEATTPFADATMHLMANIMPTEMEMAEDTTAAATEDVSSKGLKAGNTVNLNGGTIIIESTDHCLHSGGALTCNGGVYHLTSSLAKGISSHGLLTIAGGEIVIAQATEGIESKTDMQIDGGIIRILNATDDGLNTGGGTMGFRMQDGTTEETITDAAAESHNITINGGEVYINAVGDGLDSNGLVTMNGGTIWISGPTSGGNGAIDFEQDMVMNGGSILALSSRGMMEYPSTQHYCTTNTQAQAGDFVAVCDADGNVLMGMQTDKAVSDVVYYGEQMDGCQLVIGGTYNGTLSEDGTAVGGTVTGGTAAEWSLTDGGDQGGFGFGQGGGMMHGGRQDFGQMPNAENGEMRSFEEGEMPTDFMQDGDMPDFGGRQTFGQGGFGGGQAPQGEMPNANYSTNGTI